MKLASAFIGILFILFSVLAGSVQAAGCGDVWIDASSVRVEKGAAAYAAIFIQNDSEEDFLVDYASVFDSSNNFRAEEVGYAKTVPAFGRAYVNAKVEAYAFAGEGREDAFVEVKGHFQSNQACGAKNTGIKSFQVIIEEKSRVAAVEKADFSQNCAYFSLIVPDKVELEKSGTVPITIDNRTMDRATVRLSGPGLNVQPGVISVPRNTLYSERVSVSSVLGETSLVYAIEALGCNSTKATKVIAATAEEAEPKEEGQEGTLPGIAGGLFLLGEAGAIIGIVVLAGIALYFILKR